MTSKIIEDWRSDLSALPDFDEAMNITETLETGETVSRRREIPFVVFEVKPDYPALFSDKDGSWVVVYGHEGGPHKRLVNGGMAT